MHAAVGNEDADEGVPLMSTGLFDPVSTYSSFLADADIRRFEKKCVKYIMDSIAPDLRHEQQRVLWSASNLDTTKAILDKVFDECCQQKHMVG